MKKNRARVKYFKTDYKDIIEKYEDADEYLWINTDDKDLHPIRIELPECPDWDMIEGFGKEPEDQIFVPDEVPNKMHHLIKKTANEIKRNKTLKTKPEKYRAYYEKFWEELETNIIYKDILQWLGEQWYYRLNGKWYFIKGKPTYVCGWHWFYLNNWSIEDVGLPSYWDRDRKWFNTLWHFYRDTTAPKKDGDKLLYNDDGSLQLVDLGSRTSDGTNVCKGRRVGDSTKMSCINFCIITEDTEKRGGVQGDTEETAEKIFEEKFIVAFKKMPFYWKPCQFSTYGSKTELTFDHEDIDLSLDSGIDYATTANKIFYDSRKLHVYQCEEPGKLIRESVSARHDVVRRCLRSGSKMIGFAMYATTVDDIELKAGKEFEELCKQSHYEDRGDDGFTSSGLINIFIPAYEGYEGFIDKYGFSIVDTPTEEQISYIETKIYKEDGTIMGAKEYLESRRKHYQEARDFKKLSRQKRLHPFTFSECFTPSFENEWFNLDIIERRSTELKRDNLATARGDFVWVNGEDSFVQFVDNNVSGKFYISHDMKEGANKKFNNNGQWFPYNANKFVASADAFRLEKTEGGKMSNGGGAVRWMRDHSVDPDTKDVKEWTTARMVCTYNHRPETIKEYCEDMLKMCVYYGAMMYPEMNVPHVSLHFTERGYWGYLLHDTDPTTGKMKQNPGFHTQGSGIKQKIFNLIGEDIANHGMRCRHLEILDECGMIRGLDDMTNYDLFTAYGGTLLAEESNHSNYLKNMRDDDGYDIAGFF
jgi:hypothetical protein